MELHCLLTETPTTASSCSMDPPYDNCVPYAQRGRAREEEVENMVAFPAVTRLPGPCSPMPGLAPAEVSMPVSGGRGAGAWPDHSYCSWRGGLGIRGWDLDPRVNRTRGGERQRPEGWWGVEDGALMRPSPSQGEEHRSALSFYDNLQDSVTPDHLSEVLDMETSPRGQMYGAWAPEEIQGLVNDEEAAEETSPWSSCEIILAESGNRYRNPDQDKKQDTEPELDCGVRPEDSMLHLDLWNSPHAESLPHLSQTGCPVLWPPVGGQNPEETSWSPKLPPPVPLADPSASALRSLLTNLQQQIVRQREEYEARIISLEQKNKELQVEVVRLKTNLAQQRRWYQVVQAKILESEKARNVAEIHNAALQKEMDQYFETFGELNKEVKKTEHIVKSF